MQTPVSGLKSPMGAGGGTLTSTIQYRKGVGKKETSFEEAYDTWNFFSTL